MKFHAQMNRLLVSAAVSTLTLCSAHAAVEIDGGFTGAMAGPGASFTDTSFQLASGNIALYGVGDFSSLNFTPLTAYSSLITGIGSSPTPMSISDFFDFAGYQFNLTSLQTAGSGTGVAFFSGAGTLVDTSDVYADTPASFTLSFESGNEGALNYGFSFDTISAPVPESGNYGAFAGFLALLPVGAAGVMRFLRRRQVAS